MAAWWKTHTGEELMDWQMLALAGTLAHDAAGQWQHRYALWSVARQNGKSRTLEALLCWWLTEHAAAAGPQVVSLTAHQLLLTGKIFERVQAVLEGLEMLAPRGTGRSKTAWSFGRQELKTTTGSTLLVTSSNASAGHGLSIDLAVVDELWQVKEDAIYHGLMPAQRARPNPLMVMASTAGDDGSVLFKKWREDALADLDKGESPLLWYAEWSPPPDVDPHDERWWRWANPALGTTLTLDTLRLESRGPDVAAFKRADLNMWVPSASGWLMPGVWESAVHKERPVPPGGILVGDGTKDGSKWMAIRAAVDELGIGVETVISANSEGDFWDQFIALAQADRKLVLRVGAGLASHAPPALATRIGLHGTRENMKWTAGARSEINLGRVWHHGEHILSEQVGRAVLYHYENQSGLSTIRSPGDITLTRCLVVAIGELGRRESKTRAMVVAAS